MIHNPLLTLDVINENKKTLKKNIFNEVQSTLIATGIYVTPEAKKEIDETINLFVYDVYTHQCKYRHYLNTKDQLCSPDDL
jgi:hypothetical protein